MARTFNGSNQGMRSTSMATLSKPFSMSCWANSNSATANQMAFSVGDASGSHYYGVEFRGGNGGDPVRQKSITALQPPRRGRRDTAPAFGTT
jgi:hypothetical protein